MDFIIIWRQRNLIPHRQDHAGWDENDKLRLRQNGRHFENDILERILFYSMKTFISINSSLKFVP